MYTRNAPFAAFPFSLDFDAVGGRPVAVAELSFSRLAARRCCGGRRRVRSSSTIAVVARAPCDSSCCFRSRKVPVRSFFFHSIEERVVEALLGVGLKNDSRWKGGNARRRKRGTTQGEKIERRGGRDERHRHRHRPLLFRSTLRHSSAPSFSTRSSFPSSPH